MEVPRAVAGIEWALKKYPFTCPVSDTGIQFLGVGRQNNKAGYIAGSQQQKMPKGWLNMYDESKATPRSVT